MVKLAGALSTCCHQVVGVNFRILAAFAAIAAVALGGCAAQQRPMPREVASAFIDAIGDRDASRACGLLSPDTVEVIEATRGEDCAAVLTRLDLPSDPVRYVEEWGGAARASTAGGLLFLRESRAGWQVVAAGCVPAQDDWRCVMSQP